MQASTTKQQKKTELMPNQPSHSQKTTSSNGSVLRSMNNSGKNYEYSETDRHEFNLQKKISPLTQKTPVITEKTTKIKKNKKKKKKTKQTHQEKKQKCQLPNPKPIIEYSTDPFFSHSQDDDYYDDQGLDSFQDITDYISSLLQDFYDEFDKNLVKWMKGMDDQPSLAFMNLMWQLALKFQQFDQQLREYIEQGLQYQSDDPMIKRAENQAAISFKTYMIGRFPLLKDFIENFDLRVLNQQQTDYIDKLSQQNKLIQRILNHMLQIANRKRKKKDKKRKQQQKKQIQKQAQPIISYDQSVITWIRYLKIDLASRSESYATQTWVQSLKNTMDS